MPKTLVVSGIALLLVTLSYKPFTIALTKFSKVISAFLTNYFTSKVKNLPGPWHTKFTGGVLKYYTLTGRQLHYIHALHQSFGSVIRISPHQVSVSDQKAFQDIHKIGGGFLKDPWYRKFREGDDSGSIDVFSSIDPKMHGAKRKVLARPFSKTSLRQNWEDMIIEKVETTVGQIKQEIGVSGRADVFKWWTFMTSDMIGLVAFGEDFGMAETGVVSNRLCHLSSCSTVSETTFC